MKPIEKSIKYLAGKYGYKGNKTTCFKIEREAINIALKEQKKEMLKPNQSFIKQKLKEQAEEIEDWILHKLGWRGKKSKDEFEKKWLK